MARGRHWPKNLKLLNASRVPYAKSRVPIMPVEQTPDQGWQERRALYESPAWTSLRFRMIHKDPRCQVCQNAPATTLDHLLGHDDRQAATCAAALALPPVAGSWRDRFWEGPFMTCCASCHSRKTRKEMAGKLIEWLDDWKAGKLKQAGDEEGPED